MDRAPEKTVRRFSEAELMPAYLDSMRRDGSVTVPVSGTSMNPFLGHLRDTVTLVPTGERRLRRGDIALYVRRSGGLEKYVMHRVVGIKQGKYSFCGDAQTTPDRGVERDNILAVAVSACRRGKSIGEKSPVWLFYRHIWRVLRPLRPIVLSAKAFCRRK